MVFHADLASVPADVHLVRDEASGLDAAIAVHSTVLGPAAGGCRLWRYPTREAMVSDACRLAETMSYKNALAELPLGGGKAVIARPQGDFDRAALFRAFGRAVQALNGSYVTAPDMGARMTDMAVVREQTAHVAGFLPSREGAGRDTAFWAARGVFLAMQHVAERRLERPLADCTIAIQGVGQVGAALAAMLHGVGARLIVSDVDAVAAARIAVATGAALARVDTILAARADIFAPCALGGVIRHDTISRIKAKAVCGAANNPLAQASDGDRLADRGILYAPDYVINAGGAVDLAAQYLGWPQSEVATRIDAIPARLARVLDHAEEAGVAPHVAADRFARARLAAGHAATRVAA